MSARAYWRQVGAALRKNLRVQNRSRTSCLSLYVVPLALTLVLVPLCYVFVEADRLLGAETGVVRHAAADIPALGATAAIRACVKAGAPCTLAVAPDTPAARAAAAALADALYDADAGRTAPLAFCADRAALEARVGTGAGPRSHFAGVWLDVANDTGRVRGYDVYMRAGLLPADSAYTSPVTAGTSSEQTNSSRYLTAGVATLQRALHTRRTGIYTGSSSNSTAAAGVRTLLLPAHRFALFGGSAALVVAMLHTMSFSALVTVSLVKLAEERTNKTREFLLMLGLRRSAYWLSWLLTFLLHALYVDALFVAGMAAVGALAPAQVPGLLANMVAFAVALVVSFFAFQSLFSSTVVLSAVASLWLLVPVVLAYLLPIHAALHAALALLLAPFGYFLAVAQALAASLGAPALTPIPPAGFLGLFVANTALTALVAWYLNRVCTGQYGVKEHPLFVFRAPFWRKLLHLPEHSNDYSPLLGTTDDDDDDEDYGTEDSGKNKKGDSESFEPQDTREAVVRVEHMVKTFAEGRRDAVVAVDDVCAVFCQDRVTALLGENGAGKSTLIATLCGLYAPTRGDAHVDGRSVRTDMDAIRHTLGVCPQDDVLFPTMTACEHIELVAAIKDVRYPAGTDAAHYARTVLAACGVRDDEHHGCRVAKMSGGMKRKLSLTMAVVGEPRVLFLDEPTSGVDAVAKRNIWDTLAHLKHGRTVILTTHSMEEADALSDYIYIMHEGRMMTGGSPLFLKKRCGVGCYLNIDTSTPQHDQQQLAGLTALITRHVPGAQVHDQSPSTVSYLLPQQQGHSFAPLFHELDTKQARNTFGIRSYGISTSTMNDVFTQICSPHVKDDDNKDGEDDKKESTTTETKVQVLPDDNNYCARASVKRQFTSLCKAKMLYYVREKSAIGSMVLLPLFQALVFGVVFAVSMKETLGGLQGTTYSLTPTLYHSRTLPYYVNSSSSISSNDYNSTLLNDFTNCLAQTLGKTTLQRYDNFDTMEKDVVAKSGHAYGLVVNRLLSPQPEDVNITIMYNQSMTHSLPLMVDAAYNCLASLGGRDSETATLNTVHTLPEQVATESIGFDALGTAMTLCCLFALVSVTWKPMEVVVTEREKGFRQQLAIAGCRPAVYVLASVVVNGTVVLVPLTVIMVLLAAFQMIGAQAAGLLLLSAVLFCFSVAAFNYCLSLHFSKGTTATTVVSIVTTWLVSIPMLLTVLISVLLLASDVLLGSGTAFVLRVFQFLLELVPPFAFLNSVINTMILPAGYPLSMLVTWKSKYVLDVLALALDLVVYVVVALAKEYKADAVAEPVPRTNPPVFGADQDDVECEYHRVTSSSSSSSGGDAVRVVRLGKVFEPPRQNCLTACRRCCDDDDESGNGSSSNPAPVLTRVDALKDVTFGVPGSECFGLLGPNGSGKTTAMTVLTAQLDATYGHVALAGVPLARSRQQYYAACRIGNCPQAGGRLDHLTGREHLEVLLSMRGPQRSSQESSSQEDVPPGVVKADVATVLAALDMGAHADRAAQTYSGGYQRRLGVAAALLPGVRVVVLDEPSTGMDVVSQRALWAAIRAERARAGTAVLLTTHSMEEAEAVCSRLAVLLGGALAACGTLQQLRDRPSAGHVVTLAVARAACTPALLAALQAALAAPGVCAGVAHCAVAHTPAAAQVVLRLRGVRSLAALFDALDACCAAHAPAILDYTVSQATLESIFVHMVQQHEQQQQQQQQQQHTSDS